MELRDEDQNKTILLLVITIGYIVILFDLILFELNPWPYSSGSDVVSILIKSSVFYTQYESHCTYFTPKEFVQTFFLISQLITPILFPAVINFGRKTLWMNKQNQQSNSIISRIFTYIYWIITSLWLLFLITINTILFTLEEYKHARSLPYSDSNYTASYFHYLLDDYSSGIVGITLYLVVPICLVFLIQYNRNTNQYRRFEGRYTASFFVLSLFIGFSMFFLRVTPCA